MEIELWKIIATFFLGILVLIVTKVWDPIAEDVGNPFDVRRRVKNSADAVEWLGYIQVDLLDREPYPSSRRFKGWLKRVQDMCPKLEKIKAGHNGCGLNFFRKCYFGKEADKELEKATDLIDTGKELLKEAQAKPPRPGRHALPEYPHKRLRGMDSYEHMVRGFIEGKSTQPQLLGIWGMGGVGKTSLLRFVRDSYAHGSPFNHVFLVGAGNGCTAGRLQHVLSVNIGLAQPQMSGVPMAQAISSSLKRKTLLLLDDARERFHLAPFGLPVLLGRIQAELLSSYLKRKAFLLLLDDVRERLDLAAVGLPMPLGHKQKVIFTTRNQAFCAEMGCNSTSNTIQMRCLVEDDAWNLFKDKVGHQVLSGHPYIESLAKKMAAECRGLPSALCTLGRAMSTKRDVKEWRYAYDVLERMRPPVNEIQGMDDGEIQEMDDGEIQEMDDGDYSHLHRLEEALKDSFF